MAELIIRNGRQKGKTIRLAKPEVVIGREENCAIRLAGKQISRRHCRLKQTSDGFTVEDLQSRAGTLVNGRPVAEETLLQPGDRLLIGTVEFEFSTAAAGGGKSSSALTEDDVADWLMEQGDAGKAASASADEPSAGAVVERRKFASLAEEAADIIRRHRLAGGSRQ